MTMDDDDEHIVEKRRRTIEVAATILGDRKVDEMVMDEWWVKEEKLDNLASSQFN